MNRQREKSLKAQPQPPRLSDRWPVRCELQPGNVKLPVPASNSALSNRTFYNHGNVLEPCCPIWWPPAACPY